MMHSERGRWSVVMILVDHHEHSQMISLDVVDADLLRHVVVSGLLRALLSVGSER